MTRTYWDDEEREMHVPTLEVEITEPTVTHELYGPDGTVVLMILDRAWVPFGFQPPHPD